MADRPELSIWEGVPRPEPVVLQGRYVRLEPLALAHAGDLYDASAAPGAAERFQFLGDEPPSDLADMTDWVRRAGGRPDPLFFAVVDQGTGRAEGRAALLRIDERNGVIEIGSILWGPRLARTRGATEAFWLLADYAFGLGYRRLEWKCNNLHEGSKRAATRFGFTFEGTFAQHMVVKGRSRDTAWFAICDWRWPAISAAIATWLEPGNFDHHGTQRTVMKALPTTRATDPPRLPSPPRQRGAPR